MKARRTSVFLLTLVLLVQLVVSSVAAQEPTVINEIICRVNTDIITLAAYERNKQEIEADLKQKNLPPDKLKEEVDKASADLLQTMIDDRLLSQKARELDIDVENQVNQEWIKYAKESSFNTVRDFEAALVSQGISPDALRDSLKMNLQREAVIRQEVFGPVYRKITEPEAREAYQKNIDQFSTPAEVSLSEIFIGLAGHTSSEAESLAKQAVAEARHGADFKALVQKYSDANRKSRVNQGVLGATKVADLRDPVGPAVAKLKAGEVTDPIFSQEQGGYIIYRADSVKPAMAKPFEEVKDQIYTYLAYQKGSNDIQNYIKKLRKRAYIKVTEGYENLLPSGAETKAVSK